MDFLLFSFEFLFWVGECLVERYLFDQDRDINAAQQEKLKQSHGSSLVVGFF